MLSSFGFNKKLSEQISVENLSGGWRMRLALAVAIAQRPDVLLLDEPTNHLDIEGVLWLGRSLHRDETKNKNKKTKKSSSSTNYFSNQNMTVVIVSHDRGFLNRVVQEVLLFRNKQLTYHPGNYNVFERAQKEKIQMKTRKLEERTKATKEVMKQLQSSKQAASSLKRNKKGFNPKREKQEASQRKKKLDRAGIYTSDGKKFHKFKHAFLASSNIKTVGDDDVDLQDTKTIGFKFPSVHRTELRLSKDDATTSIFSMDSISMRYAPSKNNLLSDVTLGITLSSRVGIVGANGAGKTTLLSILSGDEVPSCLEVSDKRGKGTMSAHRSLRRAHISQHHTEALELQLDLTPVDVIIAAGKKLGHEVKESGARQLLGGFGLPGLLALAPVKLLSGGQKARLAMACAVHADPHMIVMDEPTNHLDDISMDCLIESLHVYQGAIVIVSHDERFLKELCNELWIVKNGGVQVVRCLDKSEFASAFDRYAASLDHN